MTLPESSITTESPWLASAEPIDEAIIMPQTLAGVFDEAFDLYKRHFPLLALIVAVGLIPTEIIRNLVVALWLHPLDAHLSGLTSANTDSYFLLRVGQFFFGEPRVEFAGVLALGVLVLLSAPISIAVSDLYFGRTTTVRECYRRSGPYVVSMMWGYCQVLLISIGILFVGAFLVLMIIGFVAMAFSRLPEIATVLSMALMVFPFCFCFGILARSFLFVTQLTVLEGLPATYVPYRNNQLVGKKRFWRSWAATTAVPVLWICFLAILHFSILSALEVLHLPATANFVAVSALSSAVYFFLAPYWTIFITLLYYDYRVRREGFDVRVLSLTPSEASLDKGGEK